ncbi:MAG: DUF1761 domain-containing protein [Minisyncoccia bacterium]
MDLDIPFLPVLVAALAGVAVRFFWCEVLFKETLTALLGHHPRNVIKRETTIGEAYAIQFLASLTVASIFYFYMVFFILSFETLGVVAGILGGFLGWIATIPFNISDFLTGKKPWKLWFIRTSNHLITLIVMGTIFSFWLLELL